MRTPIFTFRGFEEIKKQKKKLEEDRKNAVLDLKKAREMGDLSENGYYKAAKFKLGDIDRSLRRLSYLIKYGKVAEKPAKETVDVGTKVHLKTNGVLKIYFIVGEYEANPSLNKISHVSPLGKELIGKKVGDRVFVTTPSGKRIFNLEKVEN